MKNIIHLFRGFESMKRKLERSRDVIKIGLTLTARLLQANSRNWGIVDFFTRFTQEKTPQNNFSSQNFSVENKYFSDFSSKLY